MIRAVLLWTAFALGLAAPIAAQEDSKTAARAAIDALNAASSAMQEAEKSRDRIRALTQSVQAYEAGLDAVRDSLRQVALRDMSLRAAQAYREEELAQLIGMLMRIEAAPPALHLLHPHGPVGAARSAMLLAEVTPALQARARELRAELSELGDLREIQQEIEATLREGMTTAQSARAALSQAVSDRVAPSANIAERENLLEDLARTTASLDAFILSLSALPDPAASSVADELIRPGALPLPVSGTVLRGFNDADAAGITRPGMIIATRPAALVTAPTAATVRYMGPLLDLGSVLIVEPAPGVMMIFSGLDSVFGTVGDVLPKGAPIGLMGGSGTEISAIISPVGEGAFTDSMETLYIEIRENGQPVDPETWFKTVEDG